MAGKPLFWRVFDNADAVLAPRLEQAVRGDAFVPFTRFVLSHLTGRKVPGGTLTAGDPMTRFPQDVGRVYEQVQPVRVAVDAVSAARALGLEP